MQRVLGSLEPIIDKKHDDLRAYPLGANSRIWTLGQQNLHEGNLLIDDVLEKMVVNPSFVSKPEQCSCLAACAGHI